MLNGCGTGTTKTTETSYAGETIYGQVSEVSDDTIKIQIGTMSDSSDNGKSDTDSGDSSESKNTADSSTTEDSSSSDNNTTADNKSSDNNTTADNKSSDNDTADDNESSDSDKSSDKNGAGTDGEKAPQMPGGSNELELTGEETTITVDEDTEITKQSSGGPGGTPDGNAPSGEAPSGALEGNAQTPPEKPDGDNTSDSSSQDNAGTDASQDGTDNQSGDTNQTPPEKPDGDNGSIDDSDGNAPSGDSQEKRESEEISIDDISEGDTISVTFADDGTVESVVVLSSSMNGGPGGNSSGVESYDAVEEITEDTEKSDATVDSTGTDENAIHVYEGANAVLKNYTIDRTSSDSTGGDNSSFYGVGAALLTTDGTTYLSNSTITTDAAGAAGVFAYGDGTAYVADTKITTQQDTAGGIHAAGGGTLYAWDLDVETSGQSSAAIRSDRGGGTMVVDGGTYTSNGKGSPAIYSTADIAVNDAQLTANGSEAICIEGLNSIHLFDSDLTGNMSDDEQNDCTWNVILYQSMSGDSEVGNSTFEMDGGSLTAKNGGMFYTTNTESTITLSDVDITYADENDFFLRCTGNNNQRGWGTTGQNGADCLFTAADQEMEGDVIWDSISQLDFYMTEGSTLTGAVTDDETYAGEGGDGYCNLYLDKDSTWIVTGDSTLSALSNAGTIKDAEGNTVTIKGTDGTVYVQGTSTYTVTVGSYDTKGDVSGASSVSNWSDYEVAEPEELK